MSLIKKLKKYGWMIKAISQTKFSTKRAMAKGLRNRKKYFPKKRVKADIENLINCALCPNMCRFDCPAVQASKKETHSPAMKAKIGYYLEMDYLEKVEENIIPLFEGCVHCSGCKIWCPFDFAVGDLLDGVAADLFEQDVLPQPIKNFSQRIRDNNGLYKKEHYLQATKSLEAFNEGEIYYFPGCVTMGNNAKVIDSIKIIANKSSSSIISKPEDRWCCGAPSIYAGDIEKAKELAAHNSAHIKSLEVKAIICECPECTHMLKEQYPQLGFDLEVPIYHVAEWVDILLKQKKIALKNGEELDEYKDWLPISFHDPCVLARKLDVVDQPTEIMKLMFPEKFKENAYSKEHTHCCGFGGLVNIVNPELALKMAKNRLDEFSQENIKTIVTSCPTCWYSFMKANENFEFEIRDLLEIIAELIE